MLADVRRVMEAVFNWSGFGPLAEKGLRKSSSMTEAECALRISMICKAVIGMRAARMRRSTARRCASTEISPVGNLCVYTNVAAWAERVSMIAYPTFARSAPARVEAWRGVKRAS